MKRRLSRFLIILMGLCFSFSSVGLPVLAAGLPPSEVQALTQYTNWVVSVCDSSGGGDASSGGSLTGSTVPEQLFNYFVSNGLDPIHAAAILGNIAHEGVFDPTSVENIPGSGLPATSRNPAAADPYGYGIVGWTPGSQLLDILRADGITDPPYTVLAQAEAIVAELDGKNPTIEVPEVGTQFKNTKTIEDATAAFQGNTKTGGPYIGFEKPADEAGSLPDRVASAKHFLSQFGSGTVTAPSGGGGGGGGASCGCPSGGGGGGGGPLTGNTPAEQAFNYYVGKGLSDQAAAGLVGNFMAESGGDTENLDPTITNGIGAHGIAQWYSGRATDLQNYASSHSENEDTLSTQLDFSWTELTGGYSAVLGKLKTVSSASDAADIVNSDGPPSYAGGYEGSGVAPDSREVNAKKIFSEYGGGGGGGTVTGGGASDCGTTGTSDISAYQNPFRDWNNIIDNRVDQGVDYSGVGPIHPIGNGTIDVADTASGWPGGNFVSYTLSDGPAKGKEIYVAEDCKLASGISHGKPVTPSDVLCTTTTSGGYIYVETGWAAPGIDNSIDTVKQPGCYDIGNSKSTAYGMNFRELLKALGVSTNNEIDKPIVCDLPSDWPTW